MKSSNCLLIIFVLFFSACKKDTTKNAILPAATQEGKNTIGFMLNGEVWVPYAKCTIFGNPCDEILARYGDSGGAAPNGIDFGFTRTSNNKKSSLIISSTGVGTITSTGKKIDSILVTFISENSNNNDGIFSGPLTGSNFNIKKIDSLAHIISGEFQFLLIEENGSGNTITLKNGRFDFMFNTCKCSN